MNVIKPPNYWIRKVLISVNNSVEFDHSQHIFHRHNVTSQIKLAPATLAPHIISFHCIKQKEKIKQPVYIKQKVRMFSLPFEENRKRPQTFGLMKCISILWWKTDLVKKKIIEKVPVRVSGGIKTGIKIKLSCGALNSTSFILYFPNAECINMTT